MQFLNWDTVSRHRIDLIGRKDRGDQVVVHEFDFSKKSQVVYAHKVILTSPNRRTSPICKTGRKDRADRISVHEFDFSQRNQVVYDHKVSALCISRYVCVYQGHTRKSWKLQLSICDYLNLQQ